VAQILTSSRESRGEDHDDGQSGVIIQAVTKNCGKHPLPQGNGRKGKGSSRKERAHTGPRRQTCC